MTQDIHTLESNAVEAAVNANWQLALDHNKLILKVDKHNVPAMLRSGFASFQLGQYEGAQDYYKLVLKHQPQNIIANEYLEKIEIQKTSKKSSPTPQLALDPDMFLEHPGKTKSVSLNQLGQKSVLARLVVGDQVAYTVRKRHVEVRDQDDEYIGILADDIGMRLMYFIEHGSEYRINIQEASLSRVVVFIRELHKGKKVERMVSFPVDIPGSIARVMAQQHQDEVDLAELQKKQELGEDEDTPPLELDEKDDSAEDELLNDLHTDTKPEDEALLGIETDEGDDEEE